MVDVLHIDFSATYVIGPSSLENMLDFNILNGARLHSEMIIFLITSAPVNDFVKFDFKNEFKPDTSAAPISFFEWEGDIHFHVLLAVFIKKPVAI